MTGVQTINSFKKVMQVSWNNGTQPVSSLSFENPVFSWFWYAVIVTVVDSSAFFLPVGVIHDGFVSRRMVKEHDTHTSPRNPVEQMTTSKLLKWWPFFVPYQMLRQQSVGMMSKSETKWIQMLQRLGQPKQTAICNRQQNSTFEFHWPRFELVREHKAIDQFYSNSLWSCHNQSSCLHWYELVLVLYARWLAVLKTCMGLDDRSSASCFPKQSSAGGVCFGPLSLDASATENFGWSFKKSNTRHGNITFWQARLLQLQLHDHLKGI